MTTYTKLVALALVAVAASASAQGAAKTAPVKTPKTATTASMVAGYKKDLPDSLMKDAKVTEPAASVTALAKVPNGRISAVEIEREGGKLIYSYEIKVPGKKGTEEVNVNAVTGETVGDVEHETPTAEKKEARQEAREKAKKATLPVKKPSV